VNRFIEVVKALKRRRESAFACPRCGSLNLSKSTGMDGWLLPPLYLCNDCGYAGRLVLEVEAQDPTRDAPSDEGNRAAR
jgi:predicted RNA-binding Zn-ribbon protein involved in translation (DUF1610 family)